MMVAITIIVFVTDALLITYKTLFCKKEEKNVEWRIQGFLK